jgi:hypothetical protein
MGREPALITRPAKEQRIIFGFGANEPAGADGLFRRKKVFNGINLL